MHTDSLLSQLGEVLSLILQKGEVLRGDEVGGGSSGNVESVDVCVELEEGDLFVHMVDYFNYIYKARDCITYLYP